MTASAYAKGTEKNLSRKIREAILGLPAGAAR